MLKDVMSARRNVMNKCGDCNSLFDNHDVIRVRSCIKGQEIVKEKWVCPECGSSYFWETEEEEEE